MASADAAGGPRVVFHVTGFGPFATIETNPTDVVVGGCLAQAFAARQAHDPLLRHAELDVLAVLEVSTAAADAYMAALRQRILAGARDEVGSDVAHVLLHFGVAGGTRSFNLEQMAVNEARFRVPDRRGLQLLGDPVDAGEPVGCRRLTALPTPALAHELVALGYAVKPSDDAGRFLCNWIYYRSLALAEALAAELQHQGAKQPAQPLAEAATTSGGDVSGEQRQGTDADEPRDPRVVSLFVHVPMIEEGEGQPEAPAAAAAASSEGAATAPPTPKGLGLAAHVGLAVDLIRVLTRVMLPAAPAVDGADTAAAPTSGGEGGVAAYARRAVPLLAALGGPAAAFACSTVTEAQQLQAEARAAAATATASSSAAAPHDDGDEAARLVAAADSAAKSGDYASADQLRAAAAAARGRSSTSLRGAAAASGPAPSFADAARAAAKAEAAAAAAAASQSVLATLLDAGFERAQCERAVAATAPTGAGAATSPSEMADWSHRAMEWVVIASEDDAAGGGSAASAPAPAAAAPPPPPPAAAAAPAGRPPSIDASALSAALAAALAGQPLQQAAAPVEPHKMVIVVRGDLGMGAGKVAAQACHAALKAARGAASGDAASQAALRTWERTGEAVVVVRCADADELGTLVETAGAVGLRVATVRDAGRTQVAPGTVTCAAFGPAEAPAVDAITGHLKLL